ncbi:MAG TPA: response regulator [Chryseosolibacter sp.]
MRRLILLAEDDQDDRIIFAEAFEELQHPDIRLETVDDGIDLINHVNRLSHEDELPHLFILDQNMPKMTGKATLTYLKSQERFRHIPVVIYSTYPDASLVNEFIQLGADQVIAKPDSYNGFKDMVHEFMKTYVNVDRNVKESVKE